MSSYHMYKSCLTAQFRVIRREFNCVSQLATSWVQVVFVQMSSLYMKIYPQLLS